MVEVIKYETSKKNEWNAFVKQSPNNSFLFYRDYMDYHAEKFDDFSLMLYSNNTLTALLPANKVEKNVYSHQGLTYGGLILSQQSHYLYLIDYLNSINSYLRLKGIDHLIIKKAPYFYNENLEQKTELLLLRNNTKLHTNLGVAIHCNSFKYPKPNLSKKKLSLYKPQISDDINKFWDILSAHLKNKYNTLPVHSLSEIKQLSEKFPDNIKLLALINEETGEMDAGSLLYINNNIVKTQYISSTLSGRKNRASDALYYNLIKLFEKTHSFIDFGTCDDSDGNININLLKAKEKFGADTFPIFTFTIDTNSIFYL